MNSNDANRDGLRLTNTMTRTKETFRPRQNGRVKVFTCGPSIYRRPHLGNYRTFLYEDILIRYLQYSGYSVDRTLSITDIEDKSISEARKEHKSVQDLITPVIEIFRKEAEQLHIKLPDPLPRASTSIPEAVSIIRTLLEKGTAYRHNGNIYFDPLKFKNFGRLYGLDMNRWPKKKIRYSLDTYPGNRWNLGDFILWHGYRGENTVFWDTEIGKGRPSWNIEDPAIIRKHLGTAIDIHCGGIDNIYRHHDYNIAVMEAYSGEELAPYWLHGEHLIVDGMKMSKEKGNVVFPEDLGSRGFTFEEIRFFLIYGYYRRKKNLTTSNLEAARGTLRNAAAELEKIFTGGAYAEVPEAGTAALIEGIERKFRNGMNDDLHVKKAFDAVFALIGKLAGKKEQGRLTRSEVENIRSAMKSVNSVLNVFNGL